MSSTGNNKGFSSGLLLIACVAILIIVIYRQNIFDPAVVNPLAEGWSQILTMGDVESIVFQNNHVWVGGRDGVWQLERESGNVIRQLEPKKPFHFVRSLLVDHEGTLWIAHNSGLTSFKDNKFTSYTTQHGLPDVRVNTLMQDQEGRLWAGTWNSAAVLEGDAWNRQDIEIAKPENMINVMTQDHHGGLWLGSYVAPLGGVVHLSKGQVQTFSTENGLPHNNVTSIFEDRDGAVWVGTGLYQRGGLVKFVYHEDNWLINRVFMEKDGLAGPKVRSVFQDSHGMYWFGSEYDGLAILYKGQWETLNVTDGLTHPEVKSVAEDDRGAIWLGTRHGITRIQSQAVKKLRNRLELH